VATEADFQSAGLVIAVKEAEHRPMMRERFPDWADRIEYWHIHDIDVSEPAAALGELEQHVHELIGRLRSS
jgi:protein-tyrosine phosphatase